MDHDHGKYQKELLDLYKRVDAALTRSGINFFAAYGTCIGAMREKGIIPWDEDIDIAVFSADVDRAVTAINESGMDMLARSAGAISNINARVFNKIRPDSSVERRRAYVDIYILERADDSKFLFLFRALLCSGIGRIVERRKGFLGSGHPLQYAIADFVAFPLRLCTTKVLESLKLWIYKSSKGTNYFKIPGDGRFRFPAAAFSSSFRTTFMDTTIPVPIGYDELLSCSYGDWKTPPPVEKRGSHAFTGDDGAWNVTLPTDDERLINE